MVIKHYIYKCPKCKTLEFFDSTQEFTTKCPKCKIEMNLGHSFEEDTSKQNTLEKPTEPTVDHSKLKAELEGRKAIQCPTCGSYHTNKISAVGRAVSVGFWGLGSSKIGKTYECKKCGYKW